RVAEEKTNPHNEKSHRLHNQGGSLAISALRVSALIAASICCRSYGLPTTSRAKESSPNTSSSRFLLVVVRTMPRFVITLASRIVLKKCQFSSYGGERSKITTSGLCFAMYF